MSIDSLEAVLAEFKCPSEVRMVTDGPILHTHMVELGAGVRVKKVVALADDIALRLGVDSVRIVPNVPGLPYLGVEIPKRTPQMVHWKPPNYADGLLPLSLGLDVYGDHVQVDLTTAPHVLVAGATGSGKSVAMHTMICSLLMGRRPVRLLLIDPKMLEFRPYAHCGALLHPIITEAPRATRVLMKLVASMDARYAELARHSCRDITDYHAKGGRMPYVVVFIDEWADLFMMQKQAVVNPVVRLAQKARAAGIHIVLATQRPSVKVLPGIIKANFPARVALRVTNGTDSRVILDQNGAERLLGRGDMLISGFGESSLRRAHGAYVDPYAAFASRLNN
jgi:S-DNA-T family DNA segregation ATPase FtsK/SpoIIIE